MPRRRASPPPRGSRDPASGAEARRVRLAFDLGHVVVPGLRLDGEVTALGESPPQDVAAGLRRLEGDLAEAQRARSGARRRARGWAASYTAMRPSTPTCV